LEVQKNHHFTGQYEERLDKKTEAETTFRMLISDFGDQFIGFQIETEL